MSVQISHEEWRVALGAAVQPADPDAMTTAEIATMFGISRTAADRHVKALVAQGKATRTVKLTTMVNGHPKRVSAYKLVKANAARPATRAR